MGKSLGAPLGSLIAGLIFFGGICLAFFMKDEFLQFVQRPPPPGTTSSSPPSYQAKPTVSLNEEQKKLLTFSNGLFAKIPGAVRTRIQKIDFVELAMKKETRQNLETIFKASDLVLNPKGDLRLNIEALEQENSLYLMCSIEEIKSKNRILEVSDQVVLAAETTTTHR